MLQGEVADSRERLTWAVLQSHAGPGGGSVPETHRLEGEVEEEQEEGREGDRMWGWAGWPPQEGRVDTPFTERPGAPVPPRH